MKVFVTNLKGYDDRKNWMQKQLDGISLDFEFIDCVDGRKWTDEEVKSIVSPQLFDLHQNNKHWLTKGAIAATVTHRDRIYKRIIEENIPFALCLEDDVLLDKNFIAKLQEIETYLIESKFEGVLLLHHILRQKTHLSELKKTQLPNSEIYQLGPGQRIASGAAYIISNAMAEKIYDFQFPVKHIADSWHEYNIPVFFVLPVPIHTGLFESTLGYKKNIKLDLVSLFIPKQVKRFLRKRKSKKTVYKNIINE